MKVKDLPVDKVVVGLKIKGLETGRLGTVVSIDETDDRFAWVRWGEDAPFSGFYGNDCDCEVVEVPEPK